MANTKISGLTSATTPLDGTEVLPIVQSSTTKKVANNDLRPKQIQSNATSGVLQVTGPGAATTRVMTTPNANFTVARTDAQNSFSGVQLFTDTTGFTYSTNSWTASQFIGTIGTGGSLVVYTPSLNSSYGSAFAVDGSYNSGTYTSTINLYAAGVKSGGPYNSQMDIYTSAGGSLTSKFRFDATGNLLPLGAAKGVNFTANTAAAGKTSQLLNWYEEGTWTPTLTPSTSGSITLTSPTNSMRYTRVGRLVTLTGPIDVASVSSPVGDLRLTGIPFNVGGSGAGSVSVYGLGTTSTATAYQVLVDSGNTTTVFIRGYNAGNQVATVANNVQSGSGFYLTIQYIV